MSRRSTDRQKGFTMVELLVVAVVSALISGMIFVFFWSSFRSFFNIQETSIAASDKLRVVYRISQVLRSGTTITEASSTALTIYAYFSPQDSTLSQVRYSYDAGAKTLSVTRIPAQGTAPNYTYPPASGVTVTLLRGFTATGSVFSYKDANGFTGPFTTNTYKDIKEVTIDLNSASGRETSANQLKTNIVLRNRKTNL
jgi:prepilin-type N-terminal cleavage/methylation domain-containing protein